MAIKWTDEQLDVIRHRNKNMIVSAAAGSGKTAVLVERIIAMITEKDGNTDLDRLLVCTFTKAAAGEMKERIRRSLEKMIAEHPEDENLRRQSVLIHNAHISTIHGFCTDIIRNYFYHIDLDPVFRVMDEGESRLMKAECMHEIFEEEFEKKNEAILSFALSYGSGKSTGALEEEMLSAYEKIIAEPWPEVWIDEAAKRWTYNDQNDFEKSDLIRFCENQIKIAVEDLIITARTNVETAERILDKYVPLMTEDLELVSKLQQCKTFTELKKEFESLTFRTKPRKTKDEDPKAADIIAKIRKKLTDTVKDIRTRYFSESLDEVMKEINGCSGHVITFCNIMKAFMKRFFEKKRMNNLMDFSDLEHFALEILVRRNEDGSLTRTDAAKEIASGFDQIITDEYQDSNDIQELILSSVSGNEDGINNRFMVGDIKQSIYGFRHARPKLFTDKYLSYGCDTENNEVIDLSKNYRSRKEVVDTVNLFFGTMMSAQFGGVDYDERQQLNTGADYPLRQDDNSYNTEIMLLDRKDPDMESEKNRIEAIETEAMMIAQRIIRLKNEFKVWDRSSEEYRAFQYSDCAILVRAANDYFEVFSRVLQSKGIPVVAASRTGYFSTIEVRIVLDFLRVLDNPLQDIPLTAVLMSQFADLSSEEMAEIRTHTMDGSIWNACLKYMEDGGNKAIAEKLTRFFELQRILSAKAAYTPVSSLIYEIYNMTGIRAFFAAMPGGLQRMANLDMLMQKASDYEKTSYKGLFNFIRYIEELQKTSEDFGEASMYSDNADAVHIMTIHKSKGLEFPVVFLSGLNKNFNKMDTRKKILIHKELGIGIDWIEYGQGKRKKGFYKKLVGKAIEADGLSEELRVLYVAMTRAKEKLIMTMISSDLTKEIQKSLEMSAVWKDKASVTALTGAKGFSGWILPVLSNYSCFENAAAWCGDNEERQYKECDFIDISIPNINSLVREEVQEMKTIENNLTYIPQQRNAQIFDHDIADRLNNISDFKYGYETSVNTPEKVSVSEIKKLYYSRDDEQAGVQDGEQEEEIIPYVPGFIAKEEDTMTGASRGTAYHEFWKYLDYLALPVPYMGHPDLYNVLKDMKERFVGENHLSREEADCIDIKDMILFLESKLGQRMHKAALRGELYREQPFTMSIKASEANPLWSPDERVLVQGIIDAYFIEDGEIVLIDYKTDHVWKKEQLIDRYKRQLEMYREALCRSTEKNVKEIMIYSTELRLCVTM